MRNSLADYQKDGGYEGDDGCFYNDATSLLQCGLLDACMCGSPDENLSYVLRGLELIEARCNSPDDRAAWDEWWKEHDARELEHFGNLRAAYFFWYWCDTKGLTEHGGSVPGWLDDDGEKLLALLREWEALNEDSTKG